MILADTSIWIDHFRKMDERLVQHLTASLIFCHPMIVGELSLGNLKHRVEVLQLLQSLPQAILAQDDEVLEYIARAKLSGRGIGLVDAHLLLSAKLTHAKLWTGDKRLAAIAAELNLSWTA